MRVCVPSLPLVMGAVASALVLLLALASGGAGVTAGPVAGTSSSSSSSSGSVAPVPLEFDCKMRQLAVEYAEKLQPFRGASDFRALAAALSRQISAPPGVTICPNVTYRGDAPEFRPSFPIPTTSAFFVATTGSDLHGDGSESKPFGSVHRAAVECGQALRAALPCSVLCRAGTYYFDRTLSLDAAAGSGLTIQNYAGEEVVFSGGRRFAGLRFEPAPGARSPHHYAASLRGSGVREVTGLRVGGAGGAQARAFRARYPNGCHGPTTPSGYKCQGATGNPLDGFGSSLLTDWVAPPRPTMQTPRHEVQPAEPLRTVGAAFQRFQLGVGGGQCEHFDPPAGYWCGNGCAGGAPKPPGCIYRVPTGLTYNSSVLPNAPYARPEGAVVQAWHPGHWASWMFEVMGAPGSNATHLMFSRGGFQGARGSYDGGRAADSFFIENVLEELDFENEFFFDPDTQLLHYFTERPGFARADVEVTGLKVLVNVTGTMAAPVKGFTLRGVTLRNTALTYLDPHSMPSGGDWALGRSAAVVLAGVEDALIDACTFHKLDGNALFINGYARRTTVQNSLFDEIGDNIIGQLGNTVGAGAEAWGMGWDGTKGEQPRGTRIIGNLAHRCGLFEKQSSFYFQAKSCQNEIRENIFYDGPRAAVNFNDGFGGGSRLENNLLFNSVLESGDHSAVNTWDRQVYVTDVRNGTASTVKADDEISGNLIIGSLYSQDSIDNDDGSSYYSTHHNVFVYASQALKNDYSGHDNLHHANLDLFLGKGLGINAQLPGHQDGFFANRLVLQNSDGYASYDCKCAEDECPALHDNAIFTPNGQMSDVCGQSLAQRQKAGVDLGTTVRSWPSTDTLISWAREVLDLPAL